MSPITHERCSELLPRYLAGDLDGDEADAMNEHLTSCEVCASERAGLEALQGTPSLALTPEERAALESGVMAAIGRDDPRSVVVPMPARRPIGARIAQALGAAAVIAVIATFAFFGLSGGDDDAGVTTADREAGGDTEQFEQSRAGAGTGGGGGGSTNRKGTTTSEVAAADAAQGPAAEAEPPRPTFTLAGDPYTSAELQKLGESSLPSVTFAHYYSANDTDDSATLLEQLVEAARRVAGSEVAGQVEDCAQQVLDSEDAILPTFGSLGELDGNEAVVLGFAWTTGGGRLDRYMVWGWERGDCDVALEYIEGRIETSD